MTGMLDFADMQIEVDVVDQTGRANEIGQFHVKIASAEACKECFEFPTYHRFIQLVVQNHFEWPRVMLDQQP
jgi:hypothetical protein